MINEISAEAVSTRPTLPQIWELEDFLTEAGYLAEVDTTIDPYDGTQRTELVATPTKDSPQGPRATHGLRVEWTANRYARNVRWTQGRCQLLAPAEGYGLPQFVASLSSPKAFLEHVGLDQDVDARADAAAEAALERRIREGR